ncbi:sensor histidine kinase [Salinarimonas sp.]|uniref:sensor histidine kinase n=1 Tax=Salinarimonas sp. TaxID=2766526 RepID=UPI00391906AF
MAAVRLPRLRGLSLFWKIYLTLVVAVVVVALAIGALVRIGTANEVGPWAARGARFFAHVLPPQNPQAEIDRLSEALDATIAVRDASGRHLAGDPTLERSRRHNTFTLPDGRVVLVRFGREGSPPFDDGRNPLVPIAIIALVIALVAYPVVRHLTRRLERLRAGVEAWGAGDLSARADLPGSDEVAAVAKSFDRAAETIERLIAANKALLANASHELRSPLARLRMAVDLFREAPTPALEQEIVTSLSELDGLVEEILVASRLEQVADAIRAESVDLAGLAAEEGARVGAEVSGAGATVVGDARLLRRLVRNLFQNAARHGAPPIEALVEPLPDGGARLVVRDHGKGIGAADAERVFEPFYRPAGRSEAGGGWGLGLSLVRQIARRHGGDAVYREAEGGGAAFEVRVRGV